MSLCDGAHSLFIHTFLPWAFENIKRTGWVLILVCFERSEERSCVCSRAYILSLAPRGYVETGLLGRAQIMQIHDVS